MDAFPRHAHGKVQDGVNTIEDGAIPVVFEDAPTPFDCIILAMIRWIIGQPHPEAGLFGKGHEPRHELGAPTMIARPIIQVDHQGFDVGKAQAHVRPPRFEAIDETIARHLGTHMIDKEFRRRGQQNPHRNERRGRVKIMITRVRDAAAFPAAGKGPHLDRGFRIHGDA